MSALTSAISSSSPRIGVVGAGPGGLSLARLLTEKGFADVTVIERAPHVGGKSSTYHHEGLGHEMGTCYVADGYKTCKKWMDAAGMKIHPLLAHKIYDLEGRLVPFDEFVKGGDGLRDSFRMGAQALRYAKAWDRFHAWDLRGCPDDFADDQGRPMREQAARPFGEWLAERGLESIARFVMRTMTIMGYGALDRVPTAYGLRWNVPSLFLSAVRKTVGEPIPGWQHLWTHLAGFLDVRLNTTISAVTRGGEGSDFLVESDQGSFVFDHLVLTGPLDEAARWFPFTAEERLAWGIGGEVQWREYVTTLVDAEGWFRDADTRSFAAHACDGPATDAGRILVARRTGDKSAAAAARSATRRDVYVCYQYGAPERSDAALLEILMKDLARDGAQKPKVLRQARWRYAPQLGSAAILAGGLGRMERQQGQQRLWVSGATASHEAVDNIVDYNERLVERMAAAFTGRDPGDAALIEAIAGRLRLRFGET
ncbi:MAG: NAD(P)-binding protein [Nannocystis sp.]|nr:NAD(P)-binding protein [Nannocystis sp.]